MLQIRTAHAQCTKAFAHTHTHTHTNTQSQTHNHKQTLALNARDLSVITKVNVLEIRAARARCTKALVTELSGITMCCKYGQPRLNARKPSHNNTHAHTHTHKHSLSHRSNTKFNPVQHVSSIQGEKTHARRHTTRTTHTHPSLSLSRRNTT